MSIKKSLQSSIMLMAVIPVIIMAILSYVIATTKYAEINKQNSKNMASDYSFGFASQIDTQIIQNEALADINEIKAYLLEKINSPNVLLNDASGYHDTIENLFAQASNNTGNSIQYYLYDIDGYLVAASTDKYSSDWSEVMESSIGSFSETQVISISRFRADTLDIITPINVKGQTIGLIRANISINYFQTFLSGKQSNFVMDSDGNCLFGYSIDNQEDETFFKHIISISERSNGEMSDLNDSFSNNKEYLYGYATIPEHNWIYVIKQHTGGYTNIVSTLPVIFIVLLAIVVVAATQISQGLAIKYTQPIVDLSEKMQDAANGELDVRYETDREDEFGALSTNFNYMMNIISNNYNEISRARKELETNQEELQTNYRNIEKLAYTDGLTGLYNRMAFFKFSNEILTANKGSLKNHAVIFIDLDGFKSINDTLGHDYGDLLLKAVTDQLSKFIAEDDILARNGGDEFVIFRNQVPSHEDLEEFLKSLVSIADYPFVLEDETVHISLSAGAALFPQNGLSLNELMKNADIAMYSSKNSGKNCYTFFNSTMEDEVNRRNDLIDILRDAIENKDIYLLYQPQADISTGEIVGCEALMRLNSSIVGPVSPDEFIPVAEECGLIDELGEWALVEACNFNQRLMDAGFKPLQMSVNVSTAQLRGDRLIRAIEDLPNKTKMPLKYLEIELTESVLMKNFDHNLALINRMKDLGIQIALDDFGTGYSSFSYLTKIPINILKIDKSFIASICDNESDTYIAGTIINLAHHLGITVVAEGVETIEQLRILQGQMCDVLQGYFFSQAVSEEEFIEMMRINS